MAAVPDNAGPGYLDNVADAYNQGHSYDDMVDQHIEAGIDNPPPQPSLDKAMSGEPLTSSDDYKLAPTLSESLTREGINPDDFFNMAIGGTTKGVRSLVTATTEGLAGRMTPFDMAVENAANSFKSFVGNKWVRLSLGAAAGEAAYWNPEGKTGRY